MKLVKSEKGLALERLCEEVLAEGEVEAIILTKDRVVIGVRRMADG